MDDKRFDELWEQFINAECVNELRDSLQNREPNLFSVLKAADYEIRHSNFLAWLFCPKQNHGLGDRVLKAFLKAASVKGVTLGEVRVWREWQNIDILIVCESHVICIENKIWIGEHSDQLRRYQEIVEAEFPELAKIYIYLTPDGSPASEPSYKPMSYKEDIVGILEKLDYQKDKTISERTKCFIEQYLEILKGGVMGDSVDQKKVRGIIDKHGELIDYLCRIKKLDEVFRNTAECVKKWLNSKGYEICYKRDYPDALRLRFYTRGMKQYVYSKKKNAEGVHQNPVFAFEIHLYPTGFWISPTLWRQHAGSYKWEKLHEILRELYPEVEKHQKSQWINYKQIGYDLDLTQPPEKICEQLKQAWCDFKPNIDELLDHLDRHGDELRGLKREAEEKDKDAGAS